MYYTVIKHSRHLRTLKKCRKHSPAACVFYISLVFSNARRVLSQCNTRLRLLYLLNIYILLTCIQILNIKEALLLIQRTVLRYEEAKKNQTGKGCKITVLSIGRINSLSNCLTISITWFTLKSKMQYSFLFFFFLAKSYNETSKLD